MESFEFSAPQTPTDWAKKKKEPLGKLSSLFKLLLLLLNSFHEFSSREIHAESLISMGPSLLAALHTILSHISLPSLIGATFAIFSKPLAVFYEKTKWVFEGWVEMKLRVCRICKKSSIIQFFLFLERLCWHLCKAQKLNFHLLWRYWLIKICFLVAIKFFKKFMIITWCTLKPWKFLNRRKFWWKFSLGAFFPEPGFP